MGIRRQNQPRTFHTRLRDLDADTVSALAAYAHLYSQVERHLFAAIAKGVAPASLKSEYQRRYGLTARQFNAISIHLKGKIASIKERRGGLIEESKQRIRQAEKTLSRLEKQLAKAEATARSVLNAKLH